MNEDEIRDMVSDALDKLYWIARSLDHLPGIGRSLATLAKCVDADDVGRPAFRISGEIIGGEWDIREEV